MRCDVPCRAMLRCPHHPPQEKLYIMSSPSRSLNNRFLPMYNVTTCAVLNTDDDIVLRKHSDMAFMFRCGGAGP